LTRLEFRRCDPLAAGPGTGAGRLVSASGRRERIEALKPVLLVMGIVLAWLALQGLILPWLGIPT